MPKTDKLQRAITWIRRVLQVTEKSDAPNQVLGEIQPVIDVFGWDRFRDGIDAATATNTDANSVSLPAVPEDVLRLILNASVDTSNDLLAFTMWIDLAIADRGGLQMSVMRPVDIPISAGINIRCGIQDTLILRPGDILRGRCAPASGVGEAISIDVRFIDLPLGEYIRGF